MDKTDLLAIAANIANMSSRICCLRSGMNGDLFQIAYTLVDEKLPRFEHFTHAEELRFVWQALEAELTTGYLPTCVRFSPDILFATRQVTRLKPVTLGELCYIHFEFKGNHSLSLGFRDRDVCVQELARGLFFLGLKNDEECPTFD